MVPGLLGEHGLAAALAVVWVQGNLTENSDDAIVLGRVKIKVASACEQAMVYVIPKRAHDGAIKQTVQ